MVKQTVSHYRIIKRLGAGGMGEVYLAEDTILDRKVAIKFLPSESSSDVNADRRLLREAKAAATLDHPNICAIHEVGEDGGRSFIVMQYVEGETLDCKIKTNTIHVSEALTIAVQIADAISESHTRGIIHRDIKPQNIMITARGQAKVMDFGLAKEVRGPRQLKSEAETVSLLTGPGMLLGTVPYMSPEQVRGEGVDARSDIFSFGALLYEMFSGRTPFAAESAAGTISAILTREPPPLARYATDVPTELERIVRKCLEKDPERRYQTMRDLVIDLENLRGGYGAARSSDSRGGSAADEGSRQRSIFTSRRALVLSGFAVVLVSVALVYALRFRGVPATRQPEIRSLAVLPMANLSGDPGQDYFADGMTETLIAGLAKVQALRVISRTSVMQYKGARKPLPDIARELNVDAIVEGSVQRFGERVKITVQLIYAPTDQHLWSETYDRDLRDILTFQNEVARAVTQEVQIKLTPQEQMRLASARPINPEAYDYFLRGRFHLSRQTKADNETAIEMFDRAVAADPNFAAAYAELAQACVWRFFLFTPDEKRWEEKAFVAVEKALSLDPDLPEAYLARGRLFWTPFNHFPHEKAIKEYRRALALNPNLDEAQNYLALVYNHIGAFDEALQELQKAVAINPSNTLAQFRIGETLLFQGKYEQALTALRSIPREANPALVGYQTPMALLHLGRREEAAAMLEELLKDYPEDNGGLFTSVQALMAALAGEKDTAEGKIRSAIEKGKGFGHFHHTAYNLACAYSLMNKPEQAIKWLQAAADDGFPCYPLFETDPYLNPLRQDSRFATLLTRLKEQGKHYRTIS
ncbi:MAG: protein kinase [Pyrinomonadaceae bacterium]|jgi:TolB-like protein/Flp pilus assembly protein TadD/predicted Ser/Thr protein kinase|nr:protein kinase [Pyrinomonadaceae bacterium]